MDKMILTTDEIKAKQAKGVCEACGKKIKYDYWWNNQMLGIACWKKIALPELKKQREEKWEVQKQIWWEQSYALIEALRVKDYSKIRSEFKLKFLNGLVEQFDERGFISQKQQQMVRGTGGWNGSFYDRGMLNDTDTLHEMVVLYLLGSEDSQQEALRIASDLMNEKNRIMFEEATGATVKRYE